MDDSQLFLVHVWPPRPGFRASARRVDSDSPQLLKSLQELADYFALASGTAPAATAAILPQPLGGPDEPPR